jgi:hypothetical protein
VAPENRNPFGRRSRYGPSGRRFSDVFTRLFGRRSKPMSLRPGPTSSSPEKLPMSALHPRDDNLAESKSAEWPTLVRLTVYCLWDSESARSATDGRDLRKDTGRLQIEREVARPGSQADIDLIESLRIEYERPGVSEGRREEIKAAAADYAASWVQGQLGVTWWETPQSFPLSQTADLLDGSAEWLRGLVEHPLADAASRAGAEGPVVPIGAGITANFVTARLTAPLEGAARVCEVAGIVIGLATGAHPLVMVCAKRLAHDELGKALGRGFEQIIDSIGADRQRTAGRGQSPGRPGRGDYPGRGQPPGQPPGRPGRGDYPGRGQPPGRPGRSGYPGRDGR